MKRQKDAVKMIAGMVVLSGVLLVQGCSTRNTTTIPPVAVPEVEQGLLGDLNRYVWQLAGQQRAGNTEAGSILVRLMNSRGLPEPVNVGGKK
ncbi:hypothetical protein SKB45_001386 [Salmonella enterica]|uniref:Uncharacterized protein n=2 Tax=Salmonella enterica TaxID=28901 RepID=A0A624JDL6_SALER|nr:hypothetical protein [Salmonella enterica]EAT8443778.1 hypothetical protein [Salmonella enterica subsp. enterica serovar Bonariensis]EBS4770693.1 hypothetical protein [Salmonella enterica subsp. enterica serovar Sandiego]ECH8236719.1 hypothetical protein [Salmonella enterica subsp. enterica]EIB5178803.1 hypothetical protein [Salmonella enterica subsp. enterica serovar Maracaibo]EAB2306343.1 hypothetical protein [Salmonella enterica]